MALRMFLADDMKTMVDLMADLCQSLGNVRMVGSSGTEAEAIDWLEHNRHNWDVAVFDLVLAEGSGINLIARARATHPQGRIAVFSGYASAGIEEHCRHLGADAVFSKRDTQAFLEWLGDLGGSADHAPSP
jgi:DNA-binding NarL/FixJ family response regulator